MEWIMDHGEEALKPESRKSNFIQFYKKSEVHYNPLGVVAAIVSWNYRKQSSLAAHSNLLISYNSFA